MVDAFTDDTEIFSATPEPYGVAQARATSKKDYGRMYRYINITSNSALGVAHTCARKYQFSKLNSGDQEIENLPNIDFAFGHSVGAGIQTYIVTGNKQQAFLAAFLAWNIDLDLKHDKKMKSAEMAHLAVEKFIFFWDSGLGAEWEVAIFNGKPAAELVFWIDCENGCYHVGHVDIILRHKISGRYMVLELKTTAMRDPDEAMYGNSDQALSYSVVLDTIAAAEGKVNSFEVLYLAYSSVKREFTPFIFTKNRSLRADWLQSLLLDHANISTWKKLDFFPKNGDACWHFNKRCQHYGVCDMESYKKGNLETFVDAGVYPEKPDFKYTLSELMANV